MCVCVCVCVCVVYKVVASMLCLEELVYGENCQYCGIQYAIINSHKQILEIIKMVGLKRKPNNCVVCGTILHMTHTKCYIRRYASNHGIKTTTKLFQIIHRQ